MKAYLVSALGGPEFPSPPKGRRIGELPAYLPAVTSPLETGPPAAADLPWAVLHGGRVLLADGSVVRPSVVNAGPRRIYNLDPRTKLGIHFYTPDRTLEGLWRNRSRLYPFLSGFDLVFGPNFSIYEDSPRTEHLLNMKRSTVMYREMLEEGIRVVPDVGWYGREDLDRWAAWIAENKIPIVAFSTQVVGFGKRATNAWRGYLAGLKYLLSRTPEEVRVVVVGLGGPERIQALFDYIPDREFVFMNSRAFVNARKGRDAWGRPTTDANFDDLFLENVKSLNLLYTRKGMRGNAQTKEP